MEETIVSVIAEGVLGKLLSLASNELGLAWGVKNDAQELFDTLTTIKAVLSDADEKQVRNEKLKVWLEKLKDVCYDAEDVLDEIEVEDLRKQVVNSQSIRRKVRRFFSSSNPVAFRFTLGHKIKEIKERLAKIAADKDNFNLAEKVDSNHVIGGSDRETHSFVRASDVIGRDKDKEEIMKLLLHPSDGHENISVIPIVGIGGLGKTTLAKLVYNDKMVGEHFKLKMWVCVSDEFVFKKLLIDIIESAIGQKHVDKNIDQLQRILRDILMHEKYLLVLDDVWNEDYGLWVELKHLLIECVSGSKIIVTTRSDRVALIMGTIPTYKLEGLSLEECLSVFVKYAFKEGQEKQHPNLMEIGIEIVKKCGGVPLAVRALGSLLYSSTSEQDWNNLRNNEIWKLDQNENKILNALRISYNYLRSITFFTFVGASFSVSQSVLELIVSRFKFLRVLRLASSNIKVVPKKIGNLKHLRSLVLDFNPKIKELPSSIYKLQSLQYLSLFNCKELKALTRDVRYLISLQHLHFTTLQKHLPTNGIGCLNSLRLLWIHNCNNLEYLFEDIGCLRGLRTLSISECPRLISLPLGVRGLSSLENLLLVSCERLDLDLGIGSDKQDNHDELSTTWPHLRFLTIIQLPQLVEFPQWLLQCSTNTLERLKIVNCSNLKALPESMQNLQVLGIAKCPELSSLPNGMNHLISLRELSIKGCPKLSERCERETGEDWSKIAHSD